MAILIMASIKALKNDEPAEPVIVKAFGHEYRLYNYVEQSKDYSVTPTREYKEIGIDYVVDENKDDYWSSLWWSIKIDGKINTRRLIKAVKYTIKRK